MGFKFYKRNTHVESYPTAENKISNTYIYKVKWLMFPKWYKIDPNHDCNGKLVLAYQLMHHHNSNTEMKTIRPMHANFTYTSTQYARGRGFRLEGLMEHCKENTHPLNMLEVEISQTWRPHGTLQREMGYGWNLSILLSLILASGNLLPRLHTSSISWWSWSWS